MSNTSSTNNQAVQYIALNKLERSPLNVRKTAASVDDLKASILAHGLMQNLSVYPGKKGKYFVFAGGRRLSALKALQEEGRLASDFAVPCQLYTQEQAEELSLVENSVRLAMHPADQFEAFAVLIDSGLTAEQVATRFGCASKLVEQRMKLARVAPALIQAYREERLSMEALMAFTVTDDHAKQIAVYDSLGDWDEPGDIRNALTEQMVEADSKLAKFVTLEAYQAAGGTVKTDLFGEDVYLEDPALLDTLATEKLKQAEQELVAEGWGWVQVDRERDWKATQGCSRIKPEPVDAPPELVAELEAAEAEQRAVGEQIDAAEDDDELERLNERDTEIEERLDGIAEKIAAFAKFDPDQMKTAGCYAYIDRAGTLEVERGLVRLQQKAAPEAAGAADDDLPAPKPKGLPESLKRDLEAYRLGAAQAEIAKHPQIAFDLLVFKAAKAVCSISHAYDGPNVSFHQNGGGTASGDARRFISEQMDAIEPSLPLDWQELDNEAEQFAAFQSLTVEQKHALLAYCVATTLQPKLAPESDRETAYDIALAQTGGNVSAYWRPSAANFLSRIRTEQLLEMGQEIFGGSWAAYRKNAKKSALVSELDKAFAEPEKALDPDKVRKLQSWLPEGMAFGAAPVQESKPAKKAKKKAA